jgi:glycosyltransferase involved in cell wall biosynthesis
MLACPRGNFEYATASRMNSVLHLVTTGHDIQTARSLRALGGYPSASFAAETRTIGPRGSYPHLLWAVPGLRRVIADFDVVHAWDETSLTAAVLAGAARVVFTVPAGFTKRAGVGNRALRAAAVRGGVQFVTTSPAQHRAAAVAGLPPDRCHLVRPPLAATPTRDRAALRRTLGFADDDFVMLAAGESTRAADHGRAVWSGSILHVVDEHYRVLLWGRGRRFDAAASLGHKLRQPGLVVVAAARTRDVEFEDLLPAADALLVTAHSPIPTLPVAMAMAAGVPVVAVPRPELADVVADNVTALTVPSPAPRLIAQRVLDLRADPDAARRVIARGRERVGALFSPDRFISEMESVYKHAASLRRATLIEAATIVGLSPR